ncbi:MULTISPECIES: hypothetical protein [Bacillaceae]|uniref:hypothetical protein n=1 Tax=Bacillaceae TaxID=186817 RepID=UPI0003654234|nr:MULTISPECIES: hypothetical protein [Bacillaceae]
MIDGGWIELDQLVRNRTKRKKEKEAINNELPVGAAKAIATHNNILKSSKSV